MVPSGRRMMKEKWIRKKEEEEEIRLVWMTVNRPQTHYVIITSGKNGKKKEKKELRSTKKSIGGQGLKEFFSRPCVCVCVSYCVVGLNSRFCSGLCRRVFQSRARPHRSTFPLLFSFFLAQSAALFFKI